MFWSSKLAHHLQNKLEQADWWMIVWESTCLMLIPKQSVELKYQLYKNIITESVWDRNLLNNTDLLVNILFETIH